MYNFWELTKKTENLGFFLLLGIVDSIWSLLYSTSFFLIDVIIQAFQLDLVNTMAQKMSEGIRSLAGWNIGQGFSPNGMWGVLLPNVIALVGAWAAVKALQQRRIQVWTGLLGAVAITICSVGFFYTSNFIVTKINSVSKELSNHSSDK